MCVFEWNEYFGFSLLLLQQCKIYKLISKLITVFELHFNLSSGIYRNGVSIEKQK